MIRYITREDYALDLELKKAYQKWLADPMTKSVFRTMEVTTRAYLIQPSDTDTGAIALNSGYTIGMQKVLDDMRSLDATLNRQNVPEDFTTAPTS